MNKLRHILILLIISQQLFAHFCQANFNFTLMSSGSNYEVRFDNTSQGNFTSREWNFGDGSFSTQDDPSHTYQNSGIYTVCLIISNNTSFCNDTICKTVTVQNSGVNCVDSNSIDPNHPCVGNYNPVCGCNGVTYNNSCEAKYRSGVTRWTQGPCQSSTGCNALFNYSVIAGATGYTVFFNNSSTGNYDFSQWDLGDATNSNQKNPIHNYPSGTFPVQIEVCLTITDSSQNCNDSYCQFINLAPIGCFDPAALAPNTPCLMGFVPVCGCDGNTYNNACEAYNYFGITSWTNGPCVTQAGCKADFRVISHGVDFHFDNRSSGSFTSCSWDFGDGSPFSNDCHPPDHQYPQSGRYLVCLSISNPNQSCNDVYCLPVVISAPAQTCRDSTLMSNDACPTVYEPVCGCDGVTYSNACVASNYSGVSSWTDGPCSAANTLGCRAFFSFTTIASPIGYDVFFSNQSVGNNARSSWNFGDGTSSSQRNPNHTYLVPGYYLVCLTMGDSIQNCTDTYCANVRVSAGSNCVDLTVINPQVSCPAIIDPVCGCDGKTYVNSCEAYYLNGVTYWTRGTCVNGGCQAGYNYIIDSSGKGVNFTNTSIGNTTHVFWEFGDSGNSAEVNPFHLYDVNSPEVFTTCLSIYDSISNCTDSYCKDISISNFTVSCNASFVHQADSTGLNIVFTGAFSLNNANAVWDFGDGVTSSAINPTHHFQDAGKYHVCFTASSSACSDTQCDSITVSNLTDMEDLAERITDLKVYPNPFNSHTNIEYELRAPAEIKIEIFNILGKRVAFFDNGFEPSGRHHLSWDAAGVPSGVYLLRLNVNGEKYNHRLHVIR